ncbi:nucleotidyl transferase AbiEii/AbiGii toxin family protein [Thioalkalivibrio sp. HK1]|uniref:nucleotidyl transferase AbiEii/AbiGii toxin family protein n=1 Tax=Thioalkalivibrio sp. HK1 TaxID=1469245 RepID=UPI00047124EE|nr:nucleotidyl transferase AbiEii/AbiGii toxin family protein [Thioalkalivibrio sp. HK1]
MSDQFLSLPYETRRYIIDRVVGRLGRRAHLLEKDVWVVWSLQTIFESAFGEHLIFKGGTSLSKAYNIIKRFSEDVDITYDIRAIAPDLVGDSDEALPPNRSQEKRWTKEARQRLAEWVKGEAKSYLQDAALEQGLSVNIRADGERIFIAYETTIETISKYIDPVVILEFGARSTGEPAALRDVKCDMDGFVDGVVFPKVKPRVMHAERTFWEKMAAVHVFCLQQRLRAERFARHWYDLVRLDDAGIADVALKDRTLADSVVKHNAMFFRMKNVEGNPIDYGDLISGKLQLVPTGDARSALETDYKYMVDNGFLLDSADTFDDVIDRCADIERRTNRIALE